MGNFFCMFNDTTLLAAAARNVCPFPDYSPSPLFTNMLSVNSSVHLSEHYAAVQASLTPQQQQDFTQNLRSTFGQEGKVSNGTVPIVALSLAIFFDTVASRVKGKYVSDQEPIPGLFLRDPTGTYPAPVYTVSKYLRLVPHIANNPTRMRDETEKYLLELNHTGTLEVDKLFAAKGYEDIKMLNLYKCVFIGKNMEHHLKQISSNTINLGKFMTTDKKNDDFKFSFSFNCDPNEASQRFKPLVDSLDDNSKRIYKECIALGEGNINDLETIATFNMMFNLAVMMKSAEESAAADTGEFDLKANALGKWT